MSKRCPKGQDKLDILSSVDKYWCFKCRKLYPYPLKKGKKSILIKGRIGQ